VTDDGGVPPSAPSPAPTPAGQPLSPTDADRPTRTRPPAADSGSRDAKAAPPSVKALARPRNLRQSPAIAKISMVLFIVGAIAIVVEIALYASGVRHLPTWFNLIWLLAPIGLLLGLVGTVIEARKAPR
jgi:hypothetical protein